MIPSLREAPTDPGLKPRDYQVLLALAEQLDVGEWRPVKDVALRKGLRIRSRTTLWDSLTRLCGGGYIERRVARPGEVAEYRLCYQRSPVQKTGRSDAA